MRLLSRDDSGLAGRAGDQRHPWLLCQLVRLECMRRNGCLTRGDYLKAKRDTEDRFHRLLETQAPQRKAKRYEVVSLHSVAVDKASRKSQAEIDSELGGHVCLLRAASASSVTGEDERPAAGDSGPGAGTDEGTSTENTSTDDADETTDDDEAYEAYVADRVTKLRADREARRRLDEQDNPLPELPPVANLAERLRQPRPAQRYLVQDLSPCGSRTLINAQWKAVRRRDGQPDSLTGRRR